MKFYFTIIFILLCSTSKIFAGWYATYNFEGKIGGYPISLSFQYQPDYFGEPEKQNLNIIGCYKYDHINTPIGLEGIFVKETKKLS